MSPRIWSPDVVAIGDRIASMTAVQAALLKHSLADTYGIHAASVVVTPVVDEPDVLVENGVAGPGRVRCRAGWLRSTSQDQRHQGRAGAP